MSALLNLFHHNNKSKLFRVEQMIGVQTTPEIWVRLPVKVEEVMISIIMEQNVILLKIHSSFCSISLIFSL